MEDFISKQWALGVLDEIKSEVADGYGFQYEKWKTYISNLPIAMLRTEYVLAGSRTDLCMKQEAEEVIDYALSKLLPESHGLGKEILKDVDTLHPEKKWRMFDEKVKPPLLNYEVFYVTLEDRHNGDRWVIETCLAKNYEIWKENNDPNVKIIAWMPKIPIGPCVDDIK